MHLLSEWHIEVMKHIRPSAVDFWQLHFTHFWSHFSSKMSGSLLPKETINSNRTESSLMMTSTGCNWLKTCLIYRFHMLDQVTKQILIWTSTTPSSFIDIPTFVIIIHHCHQRTRIKILIYHLCPAIKITKAITNGTLAQHCFAQILNKQIYWKVVTIPNFILG